MSCESLKNAVATFKRITRLTHTTAAEAWFTFDIDFTQSYAFWSS